MAEGRNAEDRSSISEGIEKVREDDGGVGEGVIDISIMVFVSMTMISVKSTDSEVLAITVTNSSSSIEDEERSMICMYVCGVEDVTIVMGGGGKWEGKGKLGSEERRGPTTLDGSDEGTTLVRGASNMFVWSIENASDFEGSTITDDELAGLRDTAGLVSIDKTDVLNSSCMEL